MQHLQWWTDFVAWQADALPMVLVTVVRADGSTPREVGATMLLRFNLQQQWQQSDTIGGGHLEFQAIDIAKAMLKESETCVRRIERFNLSARLGQCCGGVMWLLFEKYYPLKLRRIYLGVCKHGELESIYGVTSHINMHPLGRLWIWNNNQVSSFILAAVKNGNLASRFNQMPCKC